MKRKDQSNGSDRPAKRPATVEEVQQHFRTGLFDEHTLQDYTHAYAQSKPYKHAVIDDLIRPSLLRAVRDEIRTAISFTPKETDIYKIHQSGDLANLDGLDNASLAQIPSMATLRDALYSPSFRSYLSTITAAGPLSGRKTDMAVNVYTPGCHLLCHDDVIGTRRVSYILYLTDPDTPWQASWGGALRLYPTQTHSTADGAAFKVPHHTHTHAIPPAFGQLSFFAVQPGESFHDVEEVYARCKDESDDDGGRIRMAISGWFHIPQEGEDGYDPAAEADAAKKSSLSQLQGKSAEFDQPKACWLDPETHAGRSSTAKTAAEDEADGDDDEEAPALTEEDLTFLLQYLNPRYLTPETVEELQSTFESDCSLRLGLFLSEKFSAALRTEIESLDARPAQEGDGWAVAQPPHKQRYLFSSTTATSRPVEVSESPLRALSTALFPSLAFRKWLALATGLTLTQAAVRARRFRRGCDYSLATSYEAHEPQLELCLGITPSSGWGGEDVDAEAGAEADADKKTVEDGAADGDGDNVGGYEAYMAPDEPDPSGKNEGDTSTGAGARKSGRRKEADPAVYEAGDAADDDDGILLTNPAAWNAVSIVLRDQGTLRFVKYVSAAAQGDRWDVVGEWGVEDEESDDEEGDGDEE